MIGLFQGFCKLNTYALRIFRRVAWVALGLMVLIILLQVVFRYIFNNALAWPDEAARFLMLWMVGLVAPSALRWSGFVAIDTLPSMLPRIVGSVLSLFLLALIFMVLLVAAQHGMKHVFGFGGSFDSSSLKLPLDWFGGQEVKVKLRYMYGALLFGIVTMLVIAVELIIRSVFGLFLPDTELPDNDSPLARMASE
ncbi:MAG: TRAP transporter small permease subunit [Pseudomonadota bacterium]